MRILAAILLASTVGACAAAQRDGGLATYDALQAAQQDCAAKGGTLKLKSGGNSRYVEDFACERK
jgi:hypothetical protein